MSWESLYTIHKIYFACLLQGNANGLNYTTKMSPRIPWIGFYIVMVKAAGFEPIIFHLQVQYPSASANSFCVV
jgi:hypothetical protein